MEKAFFPPPLVRRLRLVAVAAVIVTAVGAPAQSAQTGGTLKLNISGSDIDSSDPTIAYNNLSWQLEYATALKLYNFPDLPAPQGRVVIPEAAAGPPVISQDGKTYTITVKSGFRFSDGTSVTAANFAFAINRALNPAMHSIAALFVNSIASVQVNGDNLVITLTQPDPALTTKLAMPFFQAVPLTLPIDPGGVVVYPSAGPYYWAARDVGHSIAIRRNPFYTGTRPAYADGFDITTNTSADQSLQQLKADQVDYDLSALPVSAHADLGAAYGVNAPNGRYHVNPVVETDYIALNTSRAPFSSTAMRQAANFAVDRPAMVAARGAYGGRATDQILPPEMPGFRDVQAYPLDGPQYSLARALAGNSCGTVKLWAADHAVGQAEAQVFKTNLEQIGCTVQLTLFQPAQVYAAAGHRGADFDAAIVGWAADYPDPYDFLDVLLNGNNIKDDGNTNLAYFNDPTIDAKLAQANSLTGAARYAAYADLDAEITSAYAPWVAFDNRNAREFTAARLGGFLFQPLNGNADLNTFFIKTPQAITFGALPSRTFGERDFGVGASASSGLPVAFAASGNCVIAAATVHLTGAGSCTITAFQPGDTSYAPAPPVLQTFVVVKASQVIAFGPLADKTYGDAEFTVSASASSGLAVSFAATGSCSLASATLQVTSAGSCTVTASQPGDANYDAAPLVARTFAIARAPQTIAFAPLRARRYGDRDVTISANASSDLPVSFVAHGSCRVSRARVHLIAVGRCTITASQAGDGNYAAAPSVSRSFAVAVPPGKCVVPSVIGKHLAAAKRLLATGRCRTGTVRFAYSRKQKGVVLSQNPGPQRVVPARTKVALVVSRGNRR
jgi:ABC-type transport system substrate-binding protein